MMPAVNYSTSLRRAQHIRPRLIEQPPVSRELIMIIWYTTSMMIMGRRIRMRMIGIFIWSIPGSEHCLSRRGQWKLRWQDCIGQPNIGWGFMRREARFGTSHTQDCGLEVSTHTTVQNGIPPPPRNVWLTLSISSNELGSRLPPKPSFGPGGPMYL